MDRHRSIALVAICLLAVFLTLGIGACIFSAAPGERDLPDSDRDAEVDGRGAVDAEIDAGSADSGTDVGPSDTGTDAADEGLDGGDTGDVGQCDFRGIEEGVCSQGIPTPSAGDAGELVSGDGGQGCRAPETYRPDESPPEDGEPPFEVCDGLDNDCDGVVDEACPCDFNQVSEGICGEAEIDPETGQCKPPDNYEVDETTCDEDDNDCDGVTDEGCPCIYQGGEEATGVCQQAEKSAEDGRCMEPEDFVADETDEHCDSKDNDCDGDVDEQCSCQPGETEECYTGPSGSAGTGICETGTRECNDQGTWDSCTGETTPESGDSCNGLDDDCDGVVDEGCSCDYDGTSAGVCSNGQISQDGNCRAPQTYAQDETSCDGVDNDCDGVIDEGCSCDYQGTSTGVCGNATIDPSTGNCEEPDDYEQTEQTCDDKDNDCDRDVDGTDSDLSCECTDGETDSCYTGPSGTEGVGVCESGTKTCDEGSWGSCDGETTPSTEDCNGEDDDCDEAVDEGCSCDYNDTAEGVCENQTRDSDGICPEPSGYEEPESTCSDGLDNDCDGSADCGDSDCGEAVCGEGGGGATCQGGTCVEQNCSDGIDNDNDGTTDCEDPDCSGEACGLGGGGAVCNNNDCVEMACADGSDNDDDGGGDEDDTDDCRKSGLESCLSDTQCVSGSCDSASGCAQTIAVTSETSTGQLGGLSGADQWCNDVVGQQLPGTWRAILSTDTTDARDRVQISGEIYNTNGELLATDAQDLWTNGVDDPVGYDETGSSFSGDVWTGTSADGTVRETCGVGTDPCDCSQWSTSSPATDVGSDGRSDRNGQTWVEDTANSSCGNRNPIYCIDGQ